MLSQGAKKGLAAAAILILGVMLIYLAVGWFFGRSEVSITFQSANESEEGDVSAKKDYLAPDFQLTDLNGQKTELHDFKGKIVVLVFWTVWNPAAQDQIAILESYYLEMKDSPRVSLLTVDNQEDKSVVGNFIRRGDYLLPVLLDEEGLVGEIYGISALPAFYFIDQSGTVRDAYTGVLSEEEIKKRVEKLFSS